MKYNALNKYTLLVFFMLTGNFLYSQFQSPYKIANSNKSSDIDSLWVLFPDIQASKDDIVFPMKQLDSPANLNIGDSIMLDSTYKIYIKILNVKSVGPINWLVLCELPNRENTRLPLSYRMFDNRWIIEGQTGYEPLSCDHLTFRMYNQNTIIVGISYSRNCE